MRQIGLRFRKQIKAPPNSLRKWKYISWDLPRNITSTYLECSRYSAYPPYMGNFTSLQSRSFQSKSNKNFLGHFWEYATLPKWYLLCFRNYFFISVIFSYPLLWFAQKNMHTAPLVSPATNFELRSDILPCHLNTRSTLSDVLYISLIPKEDSIRFMYILRPKSLPQNSYWHLCLSCRQITPTNQISIVLTAVVVNSLLVPLLSGRSWPGAHISPFVSSLTIEVNYL